MFQAATAEEDACCSRSTVDVRHLTAGQSTWQSSGAKEVKGNLWLHSNEYAYLQDAIQKFLSQGHLVKVRVETLLISKAVSSDDEQAT